MSSVVFSCLIFISLVLMGFSIANSHILLRMASFLVWFTLAIVMFTGVYVPLANDWTLMVGWLFFILCWVPLLIHMDTAITFESNGKKWVEHGSRPSVKGESSYESYRKELRKRLSRR